MEDEKLILLKEDILKLIREDTYNDFEDGHNIALIHIVRIINKRLHIEDEKF